MQVDAVAFDNSTAAQVRLLACSAAYTMFHNFMLDVLGPAERQQAECIMQLKAFDNDTPDKFTATLPTAWAYLSIQSNSALIFSHTS